MGPGLSWHLIKFKYEGYWYFWDDRVEGYFNFTTQKVFKKPPLGCEWNEDCWITQWRMKNDD